MQADRYVTYAIQREMAAVWRKKLRAAGLPEPGPELVWGQYVLSTLFGEGWEGMNADEQVAHSIRTIHFTLRWAALDCPTFAISHGLAAKLLLTDPTGVAVEDLRWPFDSFIIQLPRPSSPITYVCGETGREVEADYLIFHRYRTRSMDGREYTELALARFEAARAASTAPAIFIAAQSADSMTILHRNWEEPTTRDALAQFLERCDMNLSKVLAGFAHDSRDVLANRAASRLCVNFALYLADLTAREQWHSDRPTNAKQRVRAKRGDLVPRRWELGREIKISPQLRAMARSNAAADPLWKLKSRFLVRGHWRNQPCGPGRTERRRQWVEPYWKGPKEGERLDRAYRVGSEEDSDGTGAD